jgi:hypothetical protein
LQPLVEAVQQSSSVRQGYLAPPQLQAQRLAKQYWLQQLVSVESVQEPTPVSPQPPEEPPLDEPPLVEPPLDDPPLDEPPLDEAPLDDPPLEEPLLDEPPVEEAPPEELPLEEPLEPLDGWQWPLTKQAVPLEQMVGSSVQLETQTPSASHTCELPPSGLHAES